MFGQVCLNLLVYFLGEWKFMAQNYIRLGKPDKAKELFEQQLEKVNDMEEYNQMIGE